MLKQVHSAFAQREYWLVELGAKALIEMYAALNVGHIDGFLDKLERLRKEGYIGIRDELVLKSLRDIGERDPLVAQSPTHDECGKLLDVIENLLQRLLLAKGTLSFAEAQAKKIATSRANDLNLGKSPPPAVD